MSGIALCLALLLLSLYQRERVYGPVRATVFNSGDVLIASHANLHEFRDGKRIRRISLSALGLGPVPTELVALADGEVMVGDVDHAALKRCSLESYTCRVVYDGSGGSAGPFSKSFKIAVDEAHNRIYASDSANHRLLALDLAGRLIAATPIDGPSFANPNDVILTAGGLIALADTDNSRVALVDPEVAPFGTVKSFFRTATPLATHGYTTPLAIAQTADGVYWTAIAGNAAHHGDVVAFRADAPHAALKRADLGLDADPLSLVALGDRVLVLDPTNLRVRTIMPDGRAGADFGGAEFAADLQAVAQRRQISGALTAASQIGLLALFALALWIALRRRRPDGGARAIARIRQHAADPDLKAGLAPGFPAAAPGADTAAARPPAAHYALEERHPVEFSATAGEYFRIWIVNLALTVITVGIYSAWATVRKRRYFHGHTRVAGDNFEYHGNPLAILRGRLIAATLFALYSYAGNISLVLKGGVLLAIAIAAPWLIVRSLAFNASNTSYRNIRFAFRGTYLRALLVIAGNGLLAIFTVGLLYPSFKARVIQFVANHHYFGTTRFATPSLTRRFYGIYGKALLIVLASAVAGSVVAFTFAVAGKGSQTAGAVAAVAAMLVIYGAYFLAFAYLQANTGNATWNSLSLGSLHFESTMRTRALAWLYFVNICAILLSLGMATPWAVVRTMRYRLDNMTLIAGGGLDGFTSGASSAVGATGEEVGAMFGFDIAL